MAACRERGIDRRWLVLRWFKERTDICVLARDAGFSIATAYRYLHEVIDVIATHAAT